MLHYNHMNPATTTAHNHHHPYTFEKTREAVITIKTLQPTLSPAERETLAILLDSDAMSIIEKSAEEADAGNFETLEDAVAK